MAEETTKKTARDLLRIAFRRRRLFFLGASLFAITALIGARYWPVKYTGTAKFTRRVDPASERLLGTRSESFDSRKLTLAHELAGEPAIERAVEALGLTQGLSRTPEGRLTAEGEMLKQALVRDTKKAVKVDWEVSSEQVDLISVSFTHSDPNLAEKLPNTIVHNYIAWVSDQTIGRLRESDDFLKEQVARCKRQYDTANAERIGFEANYAGLMPGTPGALDEQVRRIQSDMDVLRRQNTLAQKKLARLKSFASQMAGSASQPASQPSSRPASGPASQPGARPAGEPSQEVWGPNPQMDRLEEELRLAKEVLDELLRVRRMTESHPSIQAQRRRIAQIEKRIEETPAEVKVQSVYNRGVGGAVLGSIDLSVELFAAQSEVEMTRNELERLESRLEDYRALQGNFGPVRQEYEQKVQKLTERQEELKRWEERYLEVQMALAAESAKRRTQHQSVLAAQWQFRPSSPSLVIVLGFALVGGLGFGAGLVFLVKLMDRSIMTPEDAAECFDVPVCGVIGEIVTPHQRRMRTVRKWLIWPATSGMILATLALCALNIVLWLRSQGYEGWGSTWSFVRDTIQTGRLGGG